MKHSIWREEETVDDGDARRSEQIWCAKSSFFEEMPYRRMPLGIRYHT